jgi:hypothetical protein
MPGNAYSSHYSTSNLVSPTSNPLLLPKNSPPRLENRNFGAQGLASDTHRKVSVYHPDPKNVSTKTARNSSHYKTYSGITHSPLNQSTLKTTVGPNPYPIPQNPRFQSFSAYETLNPTLPLQSPKNFGANHQIRTAASNKRRRSPIKKTHIFSTETEFGRKTGNGTFELSKKNFNRTF